MVRKLYWGSGSLFAWRALIALEEKKLPFESHQISFSAREHKSPEYLAMNPRGQVPSFVDGDISIFESGAICEYLEAAYPDSGAKLMPGDLKLKAQALQYMWESQNIYTAARPLLFSSVAGAERDELKAALLRELGLWNKHLEGKEFLVGDAFSMADVFFFPCAAVAVRFGLDFTKAGFTNLARYYSGLSTRESLVKTSPPHWKDGPGNGKLADIF